MTDTWITRAKRAHRTFVLAVDAKRTRLARALDAWAPKWEKIKRLGRLR